MVLCIPNLAMRLISISQITNLNCYVSFGPTSCVVQDHTGRKIGAGRKEHGLYVLEYLHLPLSAFPAISLSATSELWHRRLGHPSESRLRHLFKNVALGKFSFSSLSVKTALWPSKLQLHSVLVTIFLVHVLI